MENENVPFYIENSSSFCFFYVEKSTIPMLNHERYLLWGIVTLFAFVLLFSTVHFHMSTQIACLRGCIVALVAFVWLFSTVRFQMCPQMACLR